MSKRTVVPVHKPYRRGPWRSRPAAIKGFRLLGYQAAFVFVYLLLVQALQAESLLLRLPLNLAVLAGFFLLLYADGVRTGANEAAFGEIILAREREGKPVLPQELKRCYHPLKGAFSAAVGTLPLFLLCLVFAPMATRQTWNLTPLPEWLAAYEERADIGLALAYYHEAAPFALQDALRIAVRLLVLPFVNLAGADNSHLLLWVERLSPLLVAVVPSGYAVGYARGEAARSRVHGQIQAGIRRQRRRQKAEQKRRTQPRQIL